MKFERKVENVNKAKSQKFIEASMYLCKPDSNLFTVGMTLSNELSCCFAELSNVVAVVVNGSVEGIVFLHQILSRKFVLATIFDHHVQLLLGHPRLGLVGVEEELLGLL